MYKIIRLLAIIFVFIMVSSISNAVVKAEVADSLSNLLNNKNICETGCANYSSEHNTLSIGNTIFTLLLIVFGAIWLYSTYKKKYIIFLASIVGIAVIGTYLYPQILAKDRVPENCPIKYEKSESVSIAKSDEFIPATDEFSSEELSSDEFSIEKISSDEFSTEDLSSDEFSSVQSSTEITGSSKTIFEYLKDPNVYEPLILLLIVALISIFIKYPGFRKTRGFFLLAGIIYLGFYRGGCPCMISSFQNTILIILGIQIKIESLIWFFTILLGSYLFGRIWCGWLCHLGALQEFLYKSFKINILKSEKSQKILKIINISVFIIWILQLILTRSNIFCQYDPFKVAFNLISPDYVGYILLAILLLSSVLIYRPFCRSFCPIGLVMGWLTFLPGSKKINKNDCCINCRKCDSVCNQRALLHEQKVTILRKQDCIICGDCFSECGIKGSLKINRKK